MTLRNENRPLLKKPFDRNYFLKESKRKFDLHSKDDSKQIIPKTTISPILTSMISILANTLILKIMLNFEEIRRLTGCDY